MDGSHSSQIKSEKGMITDNPSRDHRIHTQKLYRLFGENVGAVWERVTSAWPNFDLHKKLILSPPTKYGKEEEEYNNIF